MSTALSVDDVPSGPPAQRFLLQDSIAFKSGAAQLAFAAAE